MLSPWFFRLKLLDLFIYIIRQNSLKAGIVAQAGPELKLQPRMPHEQCRCNADYCPAGYSSVHNGGAKCNVFFGLPFYARKMELYELRCPHNNAACTVPYTGVEDGLYRVNNNCVIALHLLYASLDKFLHEGTSLTGIL